MTRRRIVEVCCDYCESMIDHCYGNTNNWLRKSSGAVVSKHGDFCDKECLKCFLEAKKEASKP